MTTQEELQNSQEKAKVMTSLSNAITRLFAMLGRKIEPEITKEWAIHLAESGYTKTQIGFACKKVLEDEKVDPYKLTIPKLLVHLKEAEVSLDDQAAKQWAVVLSYVRKGGSFHGIPSGWQARTVRAVQHIGGLERIGDTPEKNIGFVTREFVSAYKSYANIHSAKEKHMLLADIKNPQLANEVKALCEKTAIPAADQKLRRSTTDTEH